MDKINYKYYRHIQKIKKIYEIFFKICFNLKIEIILKFFLKQIKKIFQL